MYTLQGVTTIAFFNGFLPVWNQSLIIARCSTAQLSLNVFPFHVIDSDPPESDMYSLRHEQDDFF